MDKTTAKDELLAAMRQGWADWQAMLAEVGEERMTTPGVGGGEWSVKDIVAHVAWSEGWVAEFIATRSWPNVAPELNVEDQDQRNAAFVAHARDWPLSRVLGDAERHHAALVAAVEGLNAEDYADQTRLGMPPAPGWEIPRLVAANTRDHYAHHVADIRAWLDRQG